MSRQDADYFGGAGGGGRGFGGGGPSSGHPEHPQYSIEYSGGGQPRGGPSQQHDAPLPQKYRFSQEEIRAIKECNKESFYYRCLPLGTLLGCGAYYGVRYGYLKPNSRFGAGPKMAAASIIGYFIGKFSYQSVCAEKLMALPNSHLGEMLRKRKAQGQGMGFQESVALESMYSSPAAPPVVGAPAFQNSDLGMSQPHIYSDVGDTRPMSGFDSEGRSSLSGYDQYSSSNSNYDTTQQMLDDENLPAKRPQYSTTYDDLRRQNRVEFENKQFSRSPPPLASAVDSSTSPSSSSGSYGGGSYASNENRSKNKYGDATWDDKPPTHY